MPASTWNDHERRMAEQPHLPGLISAPTVAERAFVALAHRWQEEVEHTPKDRALPRATDVLALACLTLSVEWGSEFSEVAADQMEFNRVLAAGWRTVAWADTLPWELCQASFLATPMEAPAVQLLTANLDHGNSSVRTWMMEIGWFVRRWLDPDEASRRLLNNLGSTIFQPFMAAGLAACLFATIDDFLAFARSYAMPRGFLEDQYRGRVEEIKATSILNAQAPFWQLECECRRIIEQASLGLRLSTDGS